MTGFLEKLFYPSVALWLFGLFLTLLRPIFIWNASGRFFYEFLPRLGFLLAALGIFATISIFLNWEKRTRK